MFQDKKTDKVAYFGLWAEASQDRHCRSEALRICREAVNRCLDDDLRRCPELHRALAYLEKQLVRPVFVTLYRRALDIPSPTERMRAVFEAWRGLVRALGDPVDHDT
jgi:hypothetical protein